MKRLQIMVSIDGSVKHCSFWNICNICRVLSARAVGRAWTGNSRTDRPSNRFYASLATRMFPLPWIKTVFCSAFWQSHHCWKLKMLHHCSFHWSSVKSFLANCFCPASRTTLVATRFRVVVICPIIQVPHCIRVFFYFVWFVFINHIFQFYYELCTYCNILDIYLS